MTAPASIFLHGPLLRQPVINTPCQGAGDEHFAYAFLPSAIGAGMEDFLGKPILVEDLRTMVEKWTAGAAKELAT